MAKLFLIFAAFSLVSCLLPLVVVTSILICGLPLTESAHTLAWLVGLIGGVYAATYTSIEM